MAGKEGVKARVAFVNTHPIQYFAPLYRFINGSPDIEAVPVYLSDHGLRPIRASVMRSNGMSICFRAPNRFSQKVRKGANSKPVPQR